MRRAAYVALWAGAIGLATPVGAETRPPFQGRLVGSFLGAPHSADPLRAQTQAEVTLAGLLFDNLYELDTDGNVLPSLALGAPVVGEDPRDVVIAIQSDVRFHDGTPVTTADVVASLDRARNSGHWAMAVVEKVSVGEGAEVRLRLRRSAPELAELLAVPAVAIVKASRLPRGWRVVGSGPFQVANRSARRRELRLTRFDQHFAGPPYVKTLALRWYLSADAEARAYESGDSHLSLRGAVAFSGHQPMYSTRMTEGPATALVYVGFGRSRVELTGNVQFRQALSAAIGRSSLENLGTGERVVPSDHPVAIDLGGPAPTRGALAPNMTAARGALAAAKKKVDLLRRSPPPVLEVIVDQSRPDDRETAEKVVAAVDRLGLKARITALEPEEFAARRRTGRCDLYIGQLAAPGQKPEWQLAAAFAAGGSRWAASRLRRAPLELSAGIRQFRKQLPILPLFHRAVRVHHRVNVRGVLFDRLSRLSFADMFVFGAAPRNGVSPAPDETIGQ